MKNHYIIRLTHEGLPCWHIIAASRLKEPLLDKIANGSEVNVDSLGTVLASGWGNDIPNDILEKYGVTVS